MASDVFSTPFIRAQGVAGPSASVIVPTGHVYVVKQLTSYSNPIFNLQTFFECILGGTGTPALFAVQHNSGSASWFGFYGALVFLAGDEFRFQVDAGVGDAADVSAHGYDLTA